MGLVSWVQRETRPDVSALASLGMGSLNHFTVQDLCDANAAVERLKAEPFFGIKLPHIPIHIVRRATVQDASWANAAEDHTQRAFFGWCDFPGAVEQRSISLCFAEPQVSLSEKEVF